MKWFPKEDPLRVLFPSRAALVLLVAAALLAVLLAGCPDRCEANMNGLTICRGVGGSAVIMRDENTGVTCFSAAAMRCFGPDGIEVIAEK